MPAKCEKCQGAMLTDTDGDHVCINCGNRLVATAFDMPAVLTADGTLPDFTAAHVTEALTYSPLLHGVIVDPARFGVGLEREV